MVRADLKGGGGLIACVSQLCEISAERTGRPGRGGLRGNRCGGPGKLMGYCDIFILFLPGAQSLPCHWFLTLIIYLIWLPSTGEGPP